MGEAPTHRMGGVWTMSAARYAHAYGLPEVAVAGQRSDGPSAVLPLLILVIGLAAATIWFVALPIYHPSATVGRSCEVYVMPSGTTKSSPTRSPDRGQRTEVPPPRRALTGRSHTYARIASRTALKYLRRYMREASPSRGRERRGWG